MGVPDMDELSFTDSELDFLVRNALKAVIQGDCDFYNQLVAVIHHKERLVTEEVALLVTCLKAVTGAVSCIHPSHHSSLLAAILRMSLWDYGTDVMDALVELLVSLVCWLCVVPPWLCGGVFKKASELTTLCAAEAAVVVFSPGNKPHSFGHPDVGTVADRFLSQNAPLTNDGDKLLEAHQRATLNQKTLELDRLYRQLELKRKHAHELEDRRQHRSDLDYAQLAHLQVALLRFKDQFESRVRNAARLGLPYLSGAVMDSGRPNFIAGGPVQYDTMMGDSSILIPYSSTPSTPHES